MFGRLTPAPLVDDEFVQEAADGQTEGEQDGIPGVGVVVVVGDGEHQDGERHEVAVFGRLTPAPLVDDEFVQEAADGQTEGEQDG